MNALVDASRCYFLAADDISKPRTWTIGFGRFILLLAALTLPPALLAQADLPLKGVVTAKDGAPLAGVAVYGSTSNCCPSPQEEATTDANGEFALEQPGKVIHLSLEKMEPLAVVVNPGTSQIRIVMSQAQNDLTVPACTQPASNQLQVGWGTNGLRFTVPRNDIKKIRGEPDVDYLRYIIKPKKGHSYLSLWFGPYAIAMEPEDDQFVESAEFSQRNLITAKGAAIGVDSWGKLPSGLVWRHTADVGEGAEYINATPEDAALFNQIINSICIIPYPGT